jgi:hypothetical protein
VGMPRTTEIPATVHCPLENTTVDVERCAGCYWRSHGSATCGGADRSQANDWRRILRALST